ncbi:MAG: class I SAM-dependent methyltransferase [Solirubrobacteraceae bacterium]
MEVRHVLVAELLCRAVDVHAGERVLDIAAGSGNTALAAARRGAQVTATDINDAALRLARRRADVESVELHTQIADAEALPFEHGAFDIVLSTFGVMFAPDQQRAADELLRVCRPGGRIGLANWTPDGLVGASLAMVRRHAPASAGPGEPLNWGRRSGLRRLLGDRIDTLRTRRLSTDVCAPSTAAFLTTARARQGSTRLAFKLLDEPSRTHLQHDLATLHEQHNHARDGTFAAAADYLQAVGVRAT